MGVENLRAHMRTYSNLDEKLGITKATLRRYINGSSRMPFDIVLAFSELTGLSIDTLLSTKPTPRSKDSFLFDGKDEIKRSDILQFHETLDNFQLVLRNRPTMILPKTKNNTEQFRGIL